MLTFKHFLTTAFSLILLTGSAALAAAPEGEALARQQIASGNFKEAAATLRMLIYKGSKSPAIWLMLGDAYAGDKEIGAARQSYNTIVKYFPTAPEAAIAQDRANKLTAPGTQRSHPSGTESPHSATTKTAIRGRELIDRIDTVPPKFSHPAVDPATVALVRSLVGSIPRPMYKILDQGKVNIWVTPNLIDKFPNDVSYRFEHIGCYLSSQYGRTYGREIFICERHSSPEGTTTLSAVHDAKSLRCTTYTQLAHALDDCLELPSKDEQFLQLYRQDAAAVDLSSNPDMRPYALEQANGASETFGGCAASLMGDTTNLAEKISRNFPRSRAWIERRIGMLGGDGK